ncbi:unnamed protein product, partial [Sphacelaria rigidula]
HLQYFNPLRRIAGCTRDLVEGQEQDLCRVPFRTTLQDLAQGTLRNLTPYQRSAQGACQVLEPTPSGHLCSNDRVRSKN